VIPKELVCGLCGKVFEREPVSLGMIVNDCGIDTLPYRQALIWVLKYKFPKTELLCEQCFWNGEVKRG